MAERATLELIHGGIKLNLTDTEETFIIMAEGSVPPVSDAGETILTLVSFGKPNKVREQHGMGEHQLRLNYTPSSGIDENKHIIGFNNSDHKSIVESYLASAASSPESRVSIFRGSESNKIAQSLKKVGEVFSEATDTRSGGQLHEFCLASVFENKEKNKYWILIGNKNTVEESTKYFTFYLEYSDRVTKLREEQARRRGVQSLATYSRKDKRSVEDLVKFLLNLRSTGKPPVPSMEADLPAREAREAREAIDDYTGSIHTLKTNEGIKGWLSDNEL